MSHLAARLRMCATPAYLGLLDTLSAWPLGAYSLRRLTGRYAGPAIQAMRTDNATEDIGFTPQGDLNVVALLAFAGASDVQVSRWYDQSGNGLNLGIGAGGNPFPYIVKAGVLCTPGSASPRPGIQAFPVNSTQMLYGGQAAWTFAPPLTRGSVLGIPPGLPSTAFPVLAASNTTVLDVASPGLQIKADSGSLATANSFLPDSPNLIMENYTSASASITLNGIRTSGAAITNGSAYLSVGVTTHSTALFMTACEIVEFAQTLLASDQQALATDQCTYWQTPSPYRSVVLADGPYAYWPLNESSGTVAADISGNSRNGTYQAGAQLGRGVLLPGMSGAYAQLNGASNSYVDVSAANQFCAGSAWSAECWVNVASYGQPSGSGHTNGVSFLNNAPNAASSSPGFQWGAFSSPAVDGFTNALQFWPQNYNEKISPSGSAPVSGTAAHVVLTYNAGTIYMYVNGVALASTWTGAANATQTTGLFIGTACWTLGAMNGVIGEVALYARALTAQQVAAHYAAGIASRIGMLDGLTTPVVAAWSLRRLRGGYTGPCLNVRRDSDNTTKDIGFTATGDLDIASLLAFTGTANGFVTTLYDQTANASSSSNLARTVAAQQPQIVTSGALNTASTGSGRPAMLASGTASSLQDLLANASKLTLNQPFSRASVTGIPAGATSSSFTVMTGSVNYSIIALNAVNLKYQMYDYSAGFMSSNSVTAGALNSVTENYNTTASSIVVSGTTTNGSIGSGGDGTQLCIAGVLSEVAGASATFCEVVQFGALLPAADQTALYASQKTYWGTS